MLLSVQSVLRPSSADIQTRISTAAGGAEADDYSTNARFSPDGRYIVFESNATNLVAGDTNNCTDIFLKDLVTGAVTRLSTTANGAEANNYSYNARFSPDGRYIVFESDATNLVAGDTNNRVDIFLKDLATGAITRLSTTADGAEANNHSYDVRFSPDGRYIVFESDATNLVAGDTNNCTDIFLKDLVTGAVTRLPTTADGAEANNHSTNARFSLDGRYIVFESNATNLVAGDTNDVSDIFRINLPYKLNAAAITDGRFIEATLNVGNASRVSIAWGDGSSSTEAPVAGKVALQHAYASTGTKDTIVTLSEGALTWAVAYSIDVSAGAMVRNTALADTLSGGSGADSLTGDAFHNVLNGAGGNDRLDGGAGADTMDGGSGDDIYVTDGADTIVETAGGGIDTVIASLSFSLAALAQVENLTAADGSAALMLTGNNLANILTGNAGANNLSGGAGNDRLSGGLGQDRLTGGAGRDVFVFANKETGSSKKKADYILDFSGKGGDRIDLKAIDANTKKKGDQKFAFIGQKDFSKAGQVRFEKTKKETYVYLNTDNDKAAEAVIKLKGSLELSKGWFVL